MDLFFSHISKDVRPEDLHHFVMDTLKTFGLPIGIPPIDRCEILEVYDKEQQTYEYHGVVIFQDPTMGQRAMKKLSNKLLKGQYVQMREFYQRSNNNQQPLPATVDMDDFVSVSCTHSNHMDRRGSNRVTNRASYSPATSTATA